MKQLSHNDLKRAAKKIANKISKDKFKPDYIIGIATGGLFPMGLIAKELKHKKMLVVSANRINGDPNKGIKINYLPKEDLSNKKILLIDEVAETGSTLAKVKQALIKNHNIKEIKLATIGVNLDICKCIPDYYDITAKGEWIVFPWDDVSEFPEYPYVKE